MKHVYLYILAILGAFCGLCMFSYASALESGENAPYLLVLAALSGIATYLLAKRWDRKGKLPDDFTNRNNDVA